VKQIQSSLQAQGLYHGPIDGIMGPQTHDALSAYEQKQGMKQSAGLDAATLQSLISGNGGSPAVANRPANNNPPNPGGR
jgi:peptidoglycan hydrolase-like protein with peptidoglycan-binding domain